jgi:hypothetical protein
MSPTIRRAAVLGMMANDTIETVRAYLPANYSASEGETGMIIIEGTDSHGWTLDGYVIPRLASGLIHAVEVIETEEIIVR